MKRLLLIIIIIILYTSFGWTRDARQVFEPIGIKDFILGTTINDVILKAKKVYKLGLDKDDFGWQVSDVDPYLVLSHKYNTNFLANEFSLDVDSEKFFINFKDYIIDTIKYYFSVGPNNTFQFKYKLLRELKITNPHELIKLHPNIKDLKLFFYNNKLYNINYTVTLNLNEVKRLIQNFNTKYGNQTSLSSNNIMWYVNQTQIKLSVNKPVLDKLHQLDEYRADKDMFNNIKVSVDLLKDDDYSDVIEYKKDVEDDLAISLKSEITRRHEAIKDMVKKRSKPKAKKEVYDYSNVDQL